METCLNGPNGRIALTIALPGRERGSGLVLIHLRFMVVFVLEMFRKWNTVINNHAMVSLSSIYELLSAFVLEYSL